MNLSAAEPAEFSIAQIWRYPVKSMQGESLARVEVSPAGVKHDRTWAVRDEDLQTIRGAKYLPNLLLCSARYIDRDSTAGVPRVEITFPDGEALVSDDTRMHARLSDLVNKRVALWPLQPAEDREFYRNHALRDGDIFTEFRKQFGLLESEALPSLMKDLPLDVLKSAAEFSAPPGSFFDGPVLNVLTDASLRVLQERLPQSIISPQRFRPNILIADRENRTAQIEDEWVGRSLTIGNEVRAVATMKCPRCVMVSHKTPYAQKDTTITRTLVRDFDFCLSIYAAPETSGQIAIGDPVVVQDLAASECV